MPREVRGEDLSRVAHGCYLEKGVTVPSPSSGSVAKRFFLGREAKFKNSEALVPSFFFFFKFYFIFKLYITVLVLPNIKRD